MAAHTGAEEAWYGHCEQVLTWYLQHNGTDDPLLPDLVEQALEDRFESWIAPDTTTVDTVARIMKDSPAGATPVSAPATPDAPTGSSAPAPWPVRTPPRERG